ncbi:MAG: hypothetical protein ACI9W2_000660 [Gammaproteobacteria bacterium]|jgi:hypothetical protein
MSYLVCDDNERLGLGLVDCPQSNWRNASCRSLGNRDLRDFGSISFKRVVLECTYTNQGRATAENRLGDA